MPAFSAASAERMPSEAALPASRLYFCSAGDLISRRFSIISEVSTHFTSGSRACSISKSAMVRYQALLSIPMLLFSQPCALITRTAASI